MRRRCGGDAKEMIIITSQFLLGPARLACIERPMRANVPNSAWSHARVDEWVHQELLAKTHLPPGGP